MIRAVATLNFAQTGKIATKAQRHKEKDNISKFSALVSWWQNVGIHSPINYLTN
jgi:hypothetical protein